MKYVFVLLLIAAFTACSDDHDRIPDNEVKVDLQLSTVGIYNFEDYIHSLSVYAFSRSSSGMLFYKTLGNLDSEGVKKLANASTQNDAKLFPTSLPVGDYELYFVANAAGNYNNELKSGISEPSDLFLTYPEGGLNDIYFTSVVKTVVSTNVSVSVQAVLKRVVSKLIVTLYGVPQQVDSIRLTIDNVAAKIAVDGTSFPQVTSASAVFTNIGRNSRDTMVCQILTFPTARDVVSGLSIEFYMKSGQTKVKTIPDIVFAPDKFIRLVGQIDDTSGGLLNLDVEVTLLIFDDWRDLQLPDFSVDPVV